MVDGAIHWIASQVRDPTTNVIPMRIKLGAPDDGIKHAEIWRGVGASPGGPLPGERVLREIGIHEGVPKPARAGVPRDEQILDKERADHQAHASALHQVLGRALVELGRTRLLQHTLPSLLEEIECSWQTGEIRVAHEHLATGVIRTFIGNFSQAYGYIQQGTSYRYRDSRGSTPRIGRAACRGQPATMVGRLHISVRLYLLKKSSELQFRGERERWR